jgi:hypothetical protein
MKRLKRDITHLIVNAKKEGKKQAFLEAVEEGIFLPQDK